MIILVSNAVISCANMDCVFVDQQGLMHVDVSAGTLLIKNIPDNALQQVAMGFADGKRFIELDEAELVIGGEDDTGSNIE